MDSIERLAGQVEAQLAGRARRVKALPDELCYELDPAMLIDSCRKLRDAPELRFEMLMDLAGIDYLEFRKDFPLIGNVEVRYDPEKHRVVYQPVSIEPRVLVPKVIREDNRYNPALRDAPGSGS